MLGVLKIDLNARVLGVALILEVIVVAIFDLGVISSPGPEGLTTVGLSPSAATGSAMGAALTFCVASFVGFESAAIYSEECKDPKKTVARATFIAVALIGVFYAISSWLLANAVGPEHDDQPGGAGEGRLHRPDRPGARPDDGPDRLGHRDARPRLGRHCGCRCSARRCSRRCWPSTTRSRATCSRSGVRASSRRCSPRTHPKTGAPFVGSMAQSVLALVVVGAFAIAGADPVLKLFTWLTNLGALGVLLLMAVTSFAVVAYFNKRPDHDLGAWSTKIAPAIAGILMVVILVLGVANFNVLITSATERTDGHDDDRPPDCPVRQRDRRHDRGMGAEVDETTGVRGDRGTHSDRDGGTPGVSQADSKFWHPFAAMGSVRRGELVLVPGRGRLGLGRGRQALSRRHRRASGTPTSATAARRSPTRPPRR